jgi:hypothetical protein
MFVSNNNRLDRAEFSREPLGDLVLERLVGVSLPIFDNAIKVDHLGLSLPAYFMRVRNCHSDFHILSAWRCTLPKMKSSISSSLSFPNPKRSSAVGSCDANFSSTARRSQLCKLASRSSARVASPMEASSSAVLELARKGKNPCPQMQRRHLMYG